MNTKEFIEYLKNTEDKDGDYGSLIQFIWNEGKYVKNKLNEQLAPVGWAMLDMVEHYGGEGQGETYYTVYSFLNPQGETVYIQLDGWYASYNGSEYIDTFEVTPKEKTITVYETV